MIILLKTTRERIDSNLAAEIVNQQFGMRQCDAHKAIICANTLAEKYSEVQKDIAVCLTDYLKAFDKVHQGILSLTGR